MDFDLIIRAIERLFAHRQWRLNRCRRYGTDGLHYYVTDANSQVLTPTEARHRLGLTVPELLVWLERISDTELSRSGHSLRRDIQSME